MNTINQLGNKSEITKEPIHYWSYREFDFNDTFDTKTLKGTWDQVEKYVKSQFNQDKEIQDRIEDIGSMDSIVYVINYPEEIDPETNQPYEDQEIRVEFGIDAYINGFIDESDIDIDLTVVTE